MEIKITEAGSPKPGKVVGTYINEDTYDKLKKEADENYMSVSNMVRKIIYLYLNSKEEKEENKNE